MNSIDISLNREKVMEKLRYQAICLLENVRKVLDNDYKRNDMISKEPRLVKTSQEYPISWASRIK